MISYIIFLVIAIAAGVAIYFLKEDLDDTVRDDYKNKMD